MQHSPDSASPADLGKGDHRVYMHPDLSHPVVVDPNRPHLKSYVVLNALAAIDELQEEEED